MGTVWSDSIFFFLNTEGPRKDPELYYTEDVERTYYIQNQKMKENAYPFWNFTRRTLQQKGRKQSSPQTTLQKIGHGSTGDEPLGPPWLPLDDGTPSERPL
jgi:hypothetical protein